MSQSILITGSNFISRNQKALELASLDSNKFDIVEVDIQEEEEKGIAKAREINSQLARKPFQSKLLTIIVKEADKLTIEAQNALLKTLEEPPESARIILTASSKENLLTTVTSRCLEIALELTRHSKQQTAQQADLTNFSERLGLLEKTDLAVLLEDLESKLRTGILEGKSSLELKKLHRSGKILLKLAKASKSSANKKLLALIMALESAE